VIADSSDSEHAPEIRRAIDSLGSGLKLEYRSYKSDVQVIDKLNDVLGVVDTPYTALGADDDFFIPSGLNRAAVFLESHPDFIVAHGEAVAFRLKSDESHGPVDIAFEYRERTIDDALGSERLRSHFARYTSTWYSVQRTGRLRDNIGKIAALKLEPAHFTELLASGLAVIQGRVKKLQGLYMARQAYPIQREYTPSIVDWITDPDWASQYARFRDCLAEELARQDGISLDEAREVVEQAFWSYLALGLMKRFPAHYVQDGSGLRHRLRGAARRLPVIRQAWYHVRSFFPSGENKMSLPVLLRPASPYHADFMPIYRAITTAPHALQSEPRALRDSTFL
jgi:glycosyltransferase domain-containing protein